MSRIFSKAMNILVVFALLASLIPSSAQPALARTAIPLVGIFRSRVVVPDAVSRRRLAALDVTVLAEGNGDHPWALVLATASQLETLKDLRFTPLQTDDLGDLVAAHELDKPALAASLRPWLARAEAVWQTAEAERQMQTDSSQGLDHLQPLLDELTSEQQAALAALTSNDSDGDGLSDTQEQMWCTSPTNPDSDGDGESDGLEVQAAKDWLAHETDTYPINGKPFTNWPPQLPNCPDDDQDAVPDMAERWELMGLSMNRESTDGDKFDDGQELFGRTYCPGGAGQCGYGALPRTVDTWLGAEIPSWVLPPGNSPFVAAYPVIDFQVDPATIHVVTKEIRTVERTITQGEEISTGFAETDGHATTVGTIDTNTHNTWQENSTTEGGIEPGNLSLGFSALNNPEKIAPLLPTWIQMPKNGLFIQPPELAEQPRSESPIPFLPGTVSIDADSENAIRQSLFSVKDLLPTFDSIAVTGERGEQDWRFISVAGFNNLVSEEQWNLERDALWWHLVILHRNSWGVWESAIEGTPEFSRLISAVPDSILAPGAKRDLDPLQAQQISRTEYIFPWEPNKKMMYGELGVHFAGYNAMNWGVLNWAAVDFVGTTTDTDYTKNIYAASDGSISTICEDRTNATIAFRLGPFVYAHLHNDHNLHSGQEFDRGQYIGMLEVGAFPNGNCGYQIGQGANEFHLHWGFENTGSLNVAGWSLSWNSGTIKKAGDKDISASWQIEGTVIGTRGNLWATNPFPGATNGGCPSPDITSSGIPTTPNINTQHKPATFWESIGQWFGGWWGKLTTGGSWAAASTLSALPGCNNSSCAGQVSSYANTPLNYSDYRSDGQCGNGGSFYADSGGLYGVGGGGSGTALNDNGDGTFDRLRIWAETRTSGEGFSTSHSELRSDTTYKEVTRSQTNTLVSSEAWSTATTVDPTDAATLTFNYSLHNQGSDLAVNLVNIDINLLIGDLPVLTWRAPNRSGIQPGQTVGPFGSEAIQLSLDQLAAIDNGAPIRVVLADYGYDDSLYEQNAWGRSVLFHVDDGLADGDRRVDTYLIAAGLVVSETYQDVLSRYFPVEVFDAGPSDPRTGTITDIRTPEFDGTGQITAWVDHPVNERAWWELSISAGGETGGVSHFKDMPAKPRTDVYLRYLEDSDGDAYTDRAELDAFSDPGNPEIHPRPLLIAAQHTLTDTNTALVQLSLQNNGNFDASSVEVWAIAANETISITDNLVGGGGRVRAGGHVVLGARIGAPDLTAWPTGTAKPYLGGQFEGTAARTYSFRADTSGTVGNSAGLTVSWSENGVNWTPLAVGSGYTAGDWLNVADGVQIAFTAGTIVAGETFVAEAALPVDTFAYTLQSPGYTPPLIVVSYNDPQGNHKFISPVEVEHIQDDLTFYQGDMRFGLQLDAYAPEAVEAGANSAQVVFYNPTETAITGGKLFLEFATPDGTVAKEYVLAGQSFLPGPNLFTVPWNTADFTPAYDPSVDYHLLAFVTDYQGTIIENTVKNLDQLGRDQLAVAKLAEDAWDIGSVPQGTLLHKDLTLANTGFAPLKVYATGENVGFAASFLTVAPATFQTLHLTLDTGALDTGSLDTSFTLRTNDPARPLFTVNITGEITPLTAEALAQPVDEDQPWDQYVYVPGPQEINTAITFTHTIPDNPAAMHPLYVYAEDGGTLVGVGEYGPDFTGQTAPFGLFGDGSDGDLIVAAGQTYYTDDTRSALAATAASGQSNLTLANAAGFAIGQEVLVIQMQGTGAGNYEFGVIASINGNTLTLQDDVKKGYEIGGNSTAQAIRVWQYHDVIVQGGGTITAHAWDGYSGGVVVFRANNIAEIVGSISINGGNGGISFGAGSAPGGYGGGFRGGAGISAAPGSNTYGYQGEGNTGSGIPSSNNNGNGGGGGLGLTRGNSGGGGGNGDYGQSGSWGGGGIPVGTPDLTNMLLGGGGGGGGNDGNPGEMIGGGGAGAGIVFICAKTVTVTGNIFANGGYGGNTSSSENSAGGGGAGGSILIKGQNVNVGSNVVTAIGGNGGTGGFSADGGDGSYGRIRIEYISLTGTTIPTASTQRLAIVRQLPDDPSVIELASPDAITTFSRYQLQYGQRGTFSDTLHTVDYFLTLPKRHYTTATLDALFESLAATPFTYTLDIGANGTLEWSGSGSEQPALLTSPDLAAGLNAYLASTADPWGADVAVPIRVTLDTTGDVFLTDVALSPGADSDPQAGTGDLAASSTNPMETDVVTLTVTAHNLGALPAENVLASFFAGDPQEGGTYLGSVLFPPLPPGGEGQGVRAWDTTGYQGDIEVYAVLDAAEQLVELNEGNNSVHIPVTVRTRPDLQVAAIAPQGSTRQGIPTSVTVAVANRGGSDAPAQAVSLYAGDPLAGGVLIGAGSTAVASGVTETVSIPWIPTDLGPLTLYAVADSAEAVSEFDENNNRRTLAGYVGWGVPVYLDAGGSPDPAYDPAIGYGFLTSGTVVTSCGSEPSQTYRQAASGETIAYRFDHLLPERFYHLDLSFLLCSGSRTQRVLVDGMEVAGNIAVSTTPTSRSIFLDPSLYIDHSIVISIENAGLSGPVVSELLLTDIRYCYRDSGVQGEQAYTGSPDGCGWTDGEDSRLWGTLPYQSIRFDDDGNAHYRFDQLSAGLDFRLNFTFFEGDEAGRVEDVVVDGQVVLEDRALNSTAQIVSVDVPSSTYAADSWIDVSIQGTAQPVISEISVEQKTVVERPLSADLEIGMADTPDPVTAGGTLTYHLTVTNHGPDAAPGVTVFDGLPPQVTLLSAVPSQGSCSGSQTVVCSLGSLASGATATLTIQVAISPGASGTLNNSASVTASAGDASPGNNTASVTTEILSAGIHTIFLPLVKK